MSGAPDREPGPDSAEESLLASAMAEFVDLQSREEPVDVEEFVARYPEVAGQLRGELETLVAIDCAPEYAPAKEPLPERLSGCKILAEIGSGGMGRVLLAFDEALGRKVAIKTLAPRYAGRPELRERFLREARAMARLNHANVARIYRLGAADEPPHFVMEHVDGVPLTAAAQPLTLRQKAELMRKVVLAAGFLHAHGVVHRDIKPGNILVGADLEPKLLDFGLAAETERNTRLTRPGEVFGTPDYLSPEQARGEPVLGEGTDIFSLGAVLYELLTGTPPFSAPSVEEQLRKIREQDPVLPRRLNPEVPGELQSVCMKALEKAPADRYRTAREMAADLERFLAGEPVLAAPEAYSRATGAEVAAHQRAIEAWHHDRLITDSEHDAFRKCYDRLNEREDAWILEARRMSLAQVSLYLGAWVLGVGAALIALLRYAGLSGAPAAAAVLAAGAPTAWIGLRRWKSGDRRIGVAYLLASSLLLPVLLLIAMVELALFTAPTLGRTNLELFSRFESFKPITNAQLWWAILLSLPASAWLRRFTGSSVFSLAVAVTAALLAGATLLRMGLLEWIESDPGRPYFHLLPWAALFLAGGIAIERRGLAADSRHFYPFAVLFTVAALSGLATFHEPWAAWLKAAAPWTRGQVEYLFLTNAAAYTALQILCGRYPSAQMRAVARAFRFLIPGHVLTSLLLLGMEASARWGQAVSDASRRFEARAFEVLLPAAACAFVFGSVPKQMKNFFVSGLVFLAIGAVRLQQDLFKDRGWWPVALLAAGVLLMYAAAEVTPLKLKFRELKRRLLK